jgi:protein-S-isoprenylcysteine O-methyltransferase Ste14
MKIIVDFIYRIVTGPEHRRRIATPLFAGFFAFLIFLIIFLARKLDAFLHLAGPLPYPVNYLLSLPLFIAGAFLWIWSVLQFIRARGTPVPVNPPPKLVTEGPYAYIRNPMLSGIILMLFGVGFFLESPSLVFFFTPLFVAFTCLEFKLIEEPELEKRLGDAYREYRRKTPMFIPKLSRLSQQVGRDAQGDSLARKGEKG